MGPNVKKIAFWDWAHLASQASSHLYQSTYEIWKQSDKDFLSYRENNEVSADAAERRLIPHTYFVRGIQLEKVLADEPHFCYKGPTDL